MNTRYYILLLAGLVFVAWMYFGGRQYPEATSPECMHLIKALYTACSSQNPQRLERVERRLEQLHSSNRLSDVEQAAFDGIIDCARQGDWSKATSDALKFAQDQVR